MDFARVRSRSSALFALGALALAILLTGCATPDGTEEASFAGLVGVVTDAAGNPVPGASVTVVSATNYFGDAGPFVTDTSGRFALTGVQLNSTLRLQASKAGFVPTLVTRPAAGGGSTVDIAVNQRVITDLSAVLTPVGTVQQVGPAGARITTPVPNPNHPGFSIGTLVVSVLPGGLTDPTDVSVSALTGASLPAPLPADLPAPSRALQAGTQNALGLLGALAVQAQVETFSFVVQTPSPLPSSVLPLGTTLQVLRLNLATLRWERAGQATVVAGENENAGRNVIRFTGTRAGIYVVVTRVQWTFGAPAPVAPAEVMDFPPYAVFPQGYVYWGLTYNLAFPTVADANTLAFLANSFAVVALQSANGVQPVVVPPRSRGESGGRRATRNQFSASLTFVDIVGQPTIDGIRRFWVITPLVAAQQQRPTHDEGHYQGGTVVTTLPPGT